MAICSRVERRREFTRLSTLSHRDTEKEVLEVSHSRCLRASVVTEFFKKRAGNATGTGLMKFLKKAPKLPPEPGDKAGGKKGA